MDSESLYHLRELVRALDNSFISTWQSTAGWQKQLDEAREYLAEIRAAEDAVDN